MKIVDIKIFKAKSSPRRAKFKFKSRQVQMLDIYPEYNTFTSKQHPALDLKILEYIYFKIKTNSNYSGFFGPIDETQAFIIKKHLLPLGSFPLTFFKFLLVINGIFTSSNLFSEPKLYSVSFIGSGLLICFFISLIKFPAGSY